MAAGIKVEHDVDITQEEGEIADSSDSGEDHSEKSPSIMSTTIYGKELIFNHGSFPWRDMEVLEDRNPTYFVEISELTRNKPDLILHRNRKNGPVVGQAHYRRSSSLQCGVGPEDISMQWTEMKCSGVFIARSFRFEWNGKTYIMRRAKSGDYGGTGLSSMLLTHFKIVEEASGLMVALYVSEVGIARKKGTLKLASGMSQDIEILCVLGIASWRDKIRREFARSSGCGGSA